MIVLKAAYYPHWGDYAYSPTREGHFDPRVVRMLSRRRFRRQEIVWLERLYFYDVTIRCHCDELGYYRNVPRCHTYRLSRRMCNDRKAPLYMLMLRSKLFDVGMADDRSKVLWFRSPYAARRIGVVF